MNDEMSFYTVVFKVKSNGINYHENYKNMSLNDFEVVYGNENREILSIHLFKQDGFIG